jgi:hypothetical protein
LRNATAYVDYDDDRILPTTQLYLRHICAESWEIEGDHDGSQMAAVRAAERRAAEEFEAKCAALRALRQDRLNKQGN